MFDKIKALLQQRGVKHPSAADAFSERDVAVAALLLEALPGAPIVTVQSAAALTGRSEQAVNAAIPRLLDAKILQQTTLGRRNRAFEAAEMIDAFTDLERRLASPAGDTRHSPPARAAPQPRSA